MVRFATCVLLLLASGCGPTRYAELCDDAVNALCRQLYRCRPDDARAVWPNIQDCQRQLLTTIPECQSDEAKACRIDPYRSSACIDDVDNLRCDQELVLPASCELQCL